MNHQRARSAGWWLAASLALSSCGSEEPEVAPEAPRDAPNLLLITVDTLRADHLGFYGYPRDTSPRLDEIAKQWVVFNKAIVQWPKTSPSLASMLSGTYGFANGVRSTRAVVDPAINMMAEYLKEAGYNTVGVVSNPNLDALFGFDQGFDHYRQTWKPDLPPPRGLGRGPKSDAQQVTLHALEAMKERSGRGPFFLWVHYIDPHGPYRPPAEYRDRFIDDEYFDGSEVLEPAPAGRSDAYSYGVLNRVVQEEGEYRSAYYVAQYDAEIYTLDEQVNLLLRALAKMQLMDKTMVVFTADHGESLGEHDYYFEHGLFPYDACSWVPLMLRIPGLEGSRIKRIVGLIDLLPTVLDYLGLPTPPMLPGASWRSLIEGSGADTSPFVFSEAGYREDYQRVVRSARWKLIHVSDELDQRLMKGSEFELYDMRDDPHETQNLYGEAPLATQRLESKLRQWIDVTKARTRPPAKLDPSRLDEDTRRQLHELGYVGEEQDKGKPRGPERPPVVAQQRPQDPDLDVSPKDAADVDEESPAAGAAPPPPPE